MQKRKGKALVWLRNDLRTNDHASFYKATKRHETVVAYYSFDPKHFEKLHGDLKKQNVFARNS